MGAYTDNLHRRAAAKRVQSKAERLISAAILRDGAVHGSARSHAEIRRALGDAEAYVSNPADIEGFLTSAGRFVDRVGALRVAVRAGQVPESFGRTLLSSDVRW